VLLKGCTIIMLEQLRQLLTPQIEAQGFQAALSRLRQGLPPPVIWLFGKVQSGKTAIIRALTGAERAQIGSGFAPCTRWAARYDFPNADFPLAVFLDTRGLGEAGYDPREDVAAFKRSPHAARRRQEWMWPLSLLSISKPSSGETAWPVVVAQTTHHSYPPDRYDHVYLTLASLPWPDRADGSQARAGLSAHAFCRHANYTLCPSRFHIT
jgi:hypothetical protein